MYSRVQLPPTFDYTICNDSKHSYAPFEKRLNFLYCSYFAFCVIYVHRYSTQLAHMVRTQYSHASVNVHSWPRGPHYISCWHTRAIKFHDRSSEPANEYKPHSCNAANLTLCWVLIKPDFHGKLYLHGPLSETSLQLITLRQKCGLWEKFGICAVEVSIFTLQVM